MSGFTVTGVVAIIRYGARSLCSSFLVGAEPQLVGSHRFSVSVSHGDIKSVGYLIQVWRRQMACLSKIEWLIASETAL